MSRAGEPTGPSPGHAGRHPVLGRRTIDTALVLAVDLGSTAVKVGVVSLSGRILWSRSHDLHTHFGPDGAAEQDADQWWALVTSTAREALRSGAFDAADVVAVALAGQYASTVPVDAAGLPVGACLMWLDSRGAAQSRRRAGGPVAGYAPRQLWTWVRRSGGAPSLDGADPLGHRWYLQASKPDLHARARWLLEPVDYLAMRFTGVAAATPVSMVAAWLTDNRRPDTQQYDPVLLRLSGVDVAKLPPLRPSGSVLGPVMPDLADELGLRRETVVVAGMTDVCAMALGSGAVDDFAAHLSVSTTSWLSCHTLHKKTDVINQIAAVPSTVPGRYLLVDNHETSGRCYLWLQGLLGDGGSPIGFAEMDDLAAAASPGSGGVIFTPWLAGERTPVADRNARGGFHNLSLATTRSDLVRAVLEGVAYNDRWMLHHVERFVGRKLDPIRMVGGGAASSLWCRIHADVLNRTIEQVAEPTMAGLRGAAIGAALACGALEHSQVRGLVAVAETFTPDPRTAAAYERAYAEFPGIYRGQKKMFARLNGPGRG